MSSIVLQDILNYSNSSLLLIVVALVICVLGYYFTADTGVPPGPIGVPLLGYWPFIKNDKCHLQMNELRKKYGEVFSVRVTGKLYIMLASFKTLREAHITKADCFSGRTEDYSVVRKIFESGVVFSNGEKWLTIRKFFLNQFKERGMTSYKENTAEALHDNINTLVEELKKEAGKPLDILKIVSAKSNHVIRQTLFGPNTTVTESDVETFLGNYREVMSMITARTLMLIGNIARFLIVPFSPSIRKGLKTHSKIQKFLQKIIDEHKESYNEENIRDIIDCFIRERNIRQSKGDPTAEYFSDAALVASLKQFVGDAVLNGALFVTFLIKTLVDYPEEQEKIYKELVEVCGEGRNPSMEDKNKLVYTNAFINEAIRIAEFVALFPSLECTRETTIGGYRIPKGAVTVTNIYSIHNDPLVYESPEKFDPTRFITEGKNTKPELPITFGVGKRLCIGENFVMMQTFLYCAAIVKNFRMSYAQKSSFYELQTNRVLDLILTPRK